jgi:hypothetical protein
MLLPTFGSGARFPAFWEAGFDWTPDQDKGGVASIAPQAVLLQWDGRLIQLLSACLPDCDVEFRLQAPFQTIVKGKVENGRLESLRVTPESRLADVRLHGDWKINEAWPEKQGLPATLKGKSMQLAPSGEFQACVVSLRRA